MENRRSMKERDLSKNFTTSHRLTTSSGGQTHSTSKTRGVERSEPTIQRKQEINLH